jgi:hypothetical protein
MALIRCPDCGREVSDAALACPQCARPIAGGVTGAAPTAGADASRPDGAAARPEAKKGLSFRKIALWVFLALLTVNVVKYMNVDGSDGSPSSSAVAPAVLESERPLAIGDARTTRTGAPGCTLKTALRQLRDLSGDPTETERYMRSSAYCVILKPGTRIFVEEMDDENRFVRIRFADDNSLAWTVPSAFE